MLCQHSSQSHWVLKMESSMTAFHLFHINFSCLIVIAEIYFCMNVLPQFVSFNICSTIFLVLCMFLSSSPYSMHLCPLALKTGSHLHHPYLLPFLCKAQILYPQPFFYSLVHFMSSFLCSSYYLESCREEFLVKVTENIFVFQLNLSSYLVLCSLCQILWLKKLL